MALQPPGDNVWNFAYPSNKMTSSSAMISDFAPCDGDEHKSHLVHDEKSEMGSFFQPSLSILNSTQYVATNN